MNKSTTTDLDLAIARARIIVCIAAMLSIYIDPANGGFLGIEPYALAILLFHLGYAIALYILLHRDSIHDQLAMVSVVVDVCFATSLALATEGRSTSPAFVFFVFAIISAGSRFDLITCFNTTLSSVALYLIVILLTEVRLSDRYMMRAAYLAITGYVIGVFGDQRTKFEERVHRLEGVAERQGIARDLHDGYVQALAGINLRLGACERWLAQNQPAKAVNELKEIQLEVVREHDEVRQYIRSLAGASDRPSRTNQGNSLTRFKIQADFATNATIADHALLIVLEAMRNALHHSTPSTVSADINMKEGIIQIVIDDDGLGLAQPVMPPWAIASRVKEVGGSLRLSSGSGVGAHLQIELPAT